jgi:hypothetical protein
MTLLGDPLEATAGNRVAFLLVRPLMRLHPARTITRIHRALEGW